MARLPLILIPVSFLAFISSSWAAASAQFSGAYHYVDPTFSADDYQIRVRFDGDAKSENAVPDHPLTTDETKITFALYLNGDNDPDPEGMDKNTTIDAVQQIGLDEALYILQIEGESR